MSMGGCEPCGAAGKLTSAMGLRLTEAEKAELKRAKQVLKEEDNDYFDDPALLIAQLHRMCKFGRSCTCQHGRYWEQDPDNPDVPAYLDALPKDDPHRLAYEAHVRRTISN